MLNYMGLKQIFTRFTLVGSLIFFVSGCSGGSGGGGDMQVEGTFALVADSAARKLADGEGGISDLTISALGVSAVTDKLGNFSFSLDSQFYSGGPVLFSVEGEKYSAEVVVDNLPSSSGAIIQLDFVADEKGNVAAKAYDSSGVLVGESEPLPQENISDTVIRRFLWKPKSERNGNLVILVDPVGVQVTVRGAITETLFDHGPSNGRGTTARANHSGCSFGGNITVDLIDSQGKFMKLADGTFPIIIPNGCNRVDLNF